MQEAYIDFIMSISDDAFIRVSSDGLTFTRGGRPFHFCGANCYYMLTRAGDEHLRHEVTEVMDGMVAAGLTVLRFWAFCDGERWNSLQHSPGVFDERIFRGLDFVVAEAARRQLLVIPGLLDYWDSYGGMQQYARWAAMARGADPKPVTADEFYDDPHAQSLFRNFLGVLVSRVNTLTGVAYKNEPAIMAWSIVNEPRCKGDYSGSKLQAWLEATAESLKSIDSNHLITYDSEGFFGNSTPELLHYNPYDCLSDGCDWVRHGSCSNLDFLCIHLWADSWCKTMDVNGRLRFAEEWIGSHVAASAKLGKPMILGEFGLKNCCGERASLYQQVLSKLGHGSPDSPAGALLWMVAANSYEDFDKTTIYLNPTEPPQPYDAAVLQCIAECTSRLNDPSSVAGAGMCTAEYDSAKRPVRNSSASGLLSRARGWARHHTAALTGKASGGTAEL